MAGSNYGGFERVGVGRRRRELGLAEMAVVEVFATG